MVVMDGWGVGKRDDTNPIYIKNPPTINFIKHNYKAGVLQASGIAVGLPWDEEGNSEVGHLTLGSGRVLYQHYPRITLAIRSGAFFSNEVLLAAINKAKAAKKNVNIIGVLSEGNVHASLDHLHALIELAKREAVTQINLHLFTDGKDGPSKHGAQLLRGIGKKAEEIAGQGQGALQVKLGSVGGRYYGMDRDGHTDRTEKAYMAIFGQGEGATSANAGETPPGDWFEKAAEYVESQYKAGITDEYITPTAVDSTGAVKDGDSVIFFDFREDSMRQITEMFLNDPRQKTEDRKLNIVTFTNYNDKYDLPVAFPPEDVKNPLGKVISDSGRTQLRIAESNKYAHVTYFFNGFQEVPFKNEYRALVPSQNVARHDEHPEMMAQEITERALAAIAEGIYDFILINYANADIVAHTGNYNATLKAVEVVDEQIKRLTEAVLKAGGVMLITADHGNAEKLIEPDTGLPETKHDKSPVPVYIIGREFAAPKDDFVVAQTENESAGLISDVAPTILEIMGLKAPEEMTGISLLRILQ